MSLKILELKKVFIMNIFLIIALYFYAWKIKKTLIHSQIKPFVKSQLKNMFLLF